MNKSKIQPNGFFKFDLKNHSYNNTFANMINLKLYFKENFLFFFNEQKCLSHQSFKIFDVVCNRNYMITTYIFNAYKGNINRIMVDKIKQNYINEQKKLHEIYQLNAKGKTIANTSRLFKNTKKNKTHKIF